jgi:spore coat protein A
MTTPLRRRGFLGLLGATGVAGLSGLSGCGTETLGELLTSRMPLPRPFQVPLPIPPVARPVRSAGDTDYYEITQRPAEVEILPGVRTTIWGFDGRFPGPTIEARSGRRSVVRHHNALELPVSVHLHGGRTSPEHDGYPTDLILPAGERDGTAYTGGDGTAGWSFHPGSKDYIYPLEQRAASLWYHDHRMNFTGPQMYRGLAGFHLVHDDEDDALPLPKGDKDIPLMICDRAFAEDGSMLYPALDPSLREMPGVEPAYTEGVLGDVILVNGAPWPVLEVTNTRYRFRLLNASNARNYKLTLDPRPQEGAAFIQVGSDGGLLPKPIEHHELKIAPGERYDLVVDFSRYPVGSHVTLANTYARARQRDVMRFRVTRRERDESVIPKRLSDFEQLRASQATVTRDFRFQRGTGRPNDPILKTWTINDHGFDPMQVAARPRLGDTEIWRFTTDFHHPVHLHQVHFQVLSRHGREPDRQDAGWKDTVDLKAHDQVDVIVRFDGFRGRYVFHCHNLEHEDMAMMANYQIV